LTVTPSPSKLSRTQLLNNIIFSAIATFRIASPGIAVGLANLASRLFWTAPDELCHSVSATTHDRLVSKILQEEA
jgi:hypothetical protein